MVRSTESMSGATIGRSVGFFSVAHFGSTEWSERWAHHARDPRRAPDPSEIRNLVAAVAGCRNSLGTDLLLGRKSAAQTGLDDVEPYYRVISDGYMTPV